MEYSQTCQIRLRMVRNIGLNPYSNGILTDFFADLQYLAYQVGLNPYSNGILTDETRINLGHWGESLNPYSNGILTDPVIGAPTFYAEKS